jgi:hypothetical protein
MNATYTVDLTDPVQGPAANVGFAVELAAHQKEYGVGYVAAVEVLGGPRGDDIVLLGVGSPSDGPVMVGDDVARTRFTWGTAAQKGSPVRQFEDGLHLTLAAHKAKVCLRKEMS